MPLVESTPLFDSGRDYTFSSDVATDPALMVWGSYALAWGEYALMWGQETFQEDDTLISTGFNLLRATTFGQ